jgi:hypothetical protein
MQLALSRTFAAAIELLKYHKLAAVNALLGESGGVSWVLVACLSQIQFAREALIGALSHAGLHTVGVVYDRPEIAPIAFTQFEVEDKPMRQLDA